uniref:tetrahydrofolate synthase n=1 Tax=Dicentrarchus labrax TaxID=13489 RepID=A0A8P4KKX8_DICLA
MGWSQKSVFVLEVDESVPATEGDSACIVGLHSRGSYSLSMVHLSELQFLTFLCLLLLQDAIRTLSALQTDASALEMQEQTRICPQLKLQAMRGFLERVGITAEDLDHLNIIHVAGTKGKGSTCAFTERILRGYGYRTGFNSGSCFPAWLQFPHLVEVRERIRINGQPIGKELFTKYFWQVYRRLEDTKDTHGGTMPLCFPFLTVLAFHVSISVGIKCLSSSVVVCRRPWVCGIASLDIDHTEILGDTIAKIAWHKGGIFKPGVPAFTVQQPEDGLAVLRDRAELIRCPLRVCPELEDYQADCGPLHLGLAGKHQHFNASLALQLSHTWLQRRCLPESLTSTSVENAGLLQLTFFKPSPIMVKGLADTQWPGRTQILKHGAVTFFLDGAHTMRSIQACAAWFRETSAQHQKNASGRVARVLMFSIKGERDSAAMLKLLVPCHFDFAVFCPIPKAVFYCNADQTVSAEDRLQRCLDIERSWHLHSSGWDNKGTQLLSEDSLLPLPEKKGDTLVFPCTQSALQWITQGREAAPLCDAAEIHVLTTGSLYLVGGVLKQFDPAFSK